MASEQAILQQRAELLALQQSWDEEARRVNERLIELNPRNIAAHTRLARYYRTKGDSRRAAELYQRVLDLEPDNRIARNALASMADDLRTQEAVDAVTTYKDAFSWGVSARQRGDSALALALLSRALQFERSRPARVALAGAHRDLQQLDAAEALCKEVLAEAAGDSAAKVVLAAVYRDRGMLQAAKGLAQEVLRTNPNSVHAMRLLASIYSDMGEKEQAREWGSRSAASVHEGAGRGSGSVPKGSVTREHRKDR